MSKMLISDVFPSPHHHMCDVCCLSSSRDLTSSSYADHIHIYVRAIIGRFGSDNKRNNLGEGVHPTCVLLSWFGFAILSLFAVRSTELHSNYYELLGS